MTTYIGSKGQASDWFRQNWPSFVGWVGSVVAFVIVGSTQVTRLEEGQRHLVAAVDRMAVSVEKGDSSRTALALRLGDLETRVSVTEAAVHSLRDSAKADKQTLDDLRAVVVRLEALVDRLDRSGP